MTIQHHRFHCKCARMPSLCTHTGKHMIYILHAHTYTIQYLRLHSKFSLKVGGLCTRDSVSVSSSPPPPPPSLIASRPPFPVSVSLVSPVANNERCDEQDSHADKARGVDDKKRACTKEKRRRKNRDEKVRHEKKL